METGKAIYKLLKDSSDVGAICADRIYPELAQQDADLPFIVYTVTDTTPSATKNATSKLDTARVELYCISGDYEQAMDMGIAVRSALDRQSGTLSGVEVQSIDFDTSDVQFDPDQRVYVLEQTYDVRIQRTGTAQVVTQFPGNTFTVQEVDGTPSGAVNKLVFSNGTVSIDGTTATVASGGGGTLTIQETGDTNSDTADTIEFPEGSVTHDGNDKATISLLAGVITEYGANAGLTDSMFPNGLFGDINQDGTVGTQDMLAVLGNFGATASPGANQVARELERAQAQITDGNGSTFNHLRQKDAADVVTTIEGQGYDVEFFEGVNIALGRGFKSQYGSDTVADATVRRTLYISATPFPSSLAQMQVYPLGPYDNQSETLVQTVVDAYLEGLNGNGSIIVIREEVSAAPDKLLDTYTGAAAAYSVRKLDKDYTGNCMRIRRDSDDAETDIGFDSNGDLDTAAIASHCGSANGYVVTWYDQANVGGTAKNLTQSTSGDQPDIYKNGAVLLNGNSGKPCLATTGTSSTQHLTTGTLNISLPHSFTAVSTGDTNSSVVYNTTNNSYRPKAENDRFHGAVINTGTISPAWVPPTIHTLSLTSGQVAHLRWNNQNYTGSSAVSGKSINVFRIFDSPIIAQKETSLSEMIIWEEDKRTTASDINDSINSYYNRYT